MATHGLRIGMSTITRLSPLLASFACLVLVACASPPEFATPNAPIATADVQRVYLATDRRLSADLAGTTERAGALSFAQYDVTVPPDHKPGELELSDTNPDPARVFTVADARSIPTLGDFGSLVRSQTGPSRKPIVGIGAASASTVAVSTASVNVRAGPSTSYPAATVVPEGTRIATHGCSSI